MTTPNVNVALSSIFDIELSHTDRSVEELKIAATNSSIDTLEARREYVKANIISLIEKGNKALDSVINIAESTEATKDYSVVTGLIKTLVDTNMTLLECEIVHKPKSGSGDSTVNAEQITNNTVFVGSTEDLAAYLKNSSQISKQNFIENKQD